MGEIKDVPNPADSVVLPNLPGSDAGDAALANDANFDAGSVTSGGIADAAATTEATVSSAEGKTFETGTQHTLDAGSPNVVSTDPRESFSPDAVAPAVEDSGTSAVVDRSYDSARLIEAGAVVELDAGTVPTTKCGLPQPMGAPLCDPVAQCGCEEGENCAYTPGRQRRFTCVDPGTTPAQDACDLDDECAHGSVCANGLCMTTCATKADCSGDTQCEDVPTTNGVESDIRVCAKPCDPLDASSCGQGAMCAATSGAYPMCIRKRGDEGTDEDPCSSDADCEHGFGCTQEGLCRAWCTLENASIDAGEAGIASECPEHSTCEPATNDFGLGRCTAPCPVPDVTGSECSILPTSCGCALDETCYAEQTGKTVCEQPGPNGYMTWCDKNSHCAAGFSCLANLCRPICDLDTAPCADGSTCSKTLSSDSSPSACLGHCNPIDTGATGDGFTACGTGAYCAPGFDGAAQSPESHCLRGTDLKPKLLGQSCDVDTDCANGLGCNPATSTCAAWCLSTTDCATGSCSLAGSVRTRNADELVGWCR